MTQDISPHELDQQWLLQKGKYTEDQVEYFCERVAIRWCDGDKPDNVARNGAYGDLKRQIIETK